MRLPRIVLPLALLALAGCATNLEKEVGSDEGLAPGKGLAMLTVSFNGRTSWPTEVNLRTPPFATLWFVREDSPDKQVNDAYTQLYGTNTTAVYAPELAAGRYRLFTFFTTFQESTGTGTMMYSFRWPLPLELGSVEVRPGQVTQLGNLIYDELVPRTEQYQLALDRNPAIEAAVLKGLFPQVAGTATVSETGWNPAAEKVLTERRRQIAANSKLLLNPRRLADGSVLGGSSVGQVLRRDPKGAWQRLDTGTSFEVRTAVQLRDGRLLAGGEMGRLVVADRDGRDWKVAANAPPFGVIEWLDVQADGSLIAVVLQKKHTLILSAPSPDAGASWKELARVSHDAYGDIVGSPFDKCFVQRAGDLMILHHQPWRFDVFDLAAGALRPPHKLRQLPHRVENATVVADGSIFAFLRKGSDEALGVSNDRGVTWKSRTLGRRGERVAHAYFGSAREGFRLVAAPDQGPATDRPVRVETTVDGGGSWTASRELPYPQHVWPLGPGEFVISGTHGDGHALWWTKDSGKTWTSERLPGGS